MTRMSSNGNGKLPEDSPQEVEDDKEKGEVKEKEKEKEKEKGGKKVKKAKAVIDKESVQLELDAGIDTVGKFFDPIPESFNLLEAKTLPDEDVRKLLELHKQKQKKRTAVRVTKETIKLSFVDETIQDIMIPHNEIPKLWAPCHRGKQVLSISRRMEGETNPVKYRIYFVQLERNKGTDQFLQKLGLSYKEFLVNGGNKANDSSEIEARTSDNDEAAECEPTSDGSEDKIDEVKNETEATPETPAVSEVSASNLLDLDDGPESSKTTDITFDSLLADTSAPAPAPATPVSVASKNAILDLYATPSTATPSSVGWASFNTSPIQEQMNTQFLSPNANFAATPTMKVPTLLPPALTPPPGRNSPSNKRRAISPQTAPATPMPAVGVATLGSQSQPVTPFAPAFATQSAGLFVTPEPTSQRSASPFGTNGTNGQSLFQNTTNPTNPFAQPTVSYGGAFELNNLEEAFKEIRSPMPAHAPPSMLQPQVVDKDTLDKQVDNPFETSEPQQPQISQAQVKNAFGDLLSGFDFKPQSGQLASPKEMFEARERKDKGPTLNDLIQN